MLLPLNKQPDMLRKIRSYHPRKNSQDTELLLYWSSITHTSEDQEKLSIITLFLLAFILKLTNYCSKLAFAVSLLFEMIIFIQKEWIYFC